LSSYNHVRKRTLFTQTTVLLLITYEQLAQTVENKINNWRCEHGFGCSNSNYTKYFR